MRDYLKRRQDLDMVAYGRLMQLRYGSMRKRLAAPRIIGEIEPYNGQMLTFTLCNGCERVFYPARDRCLEFDCEGPVEQRTLPINARLLTAKKLTLKDRLISNFQLMKQGKVLLVDALITELTPGTELESSLRRIDDEGKTGLILYGPAYRPAFRSKIQHEHKEPQVLAS